VAVSPCAREVRGCHDENYRPAVRRDVQIGNVLDPVKILNRESAFLSMGREREQQDEREQKNATHHSLDSFGYGNDCNHYDSNVVLAVRVFYYEMGKGQS
jgi:hypothetical protein